MHSPSPTHHTEILCISQPLQPSLGERADPSLPLSVCTMFNIALQFNIVLHSQKQVFLFGLLSHFTVHRQLIKKGTNKPAASWHPHKLELQQGPCQLFCPPCSWNQHCVGFHSDQLPATDSMRCNAIFWTLTQQHIILIINIKNEQKHYEQ